jgi:23S rRNA (uracil1939-C5)-methyltransferase
MKKFDELTVKLEHVAFEGKCVTRLNGLVLFVNGGVPGDEARVRVQKIKKQHAEAEVVEVLKKSSLRTEPRCKHFGICGGCRWQHVDYQAQLDFKRQHVIDALERIGGFTGIAVNPTLGSERVYFYRNKMEFSFGEMWLPQHEHESRIQNPLSAQPLPNVALGLHPAGLYQKVLDIEECHLQSDTSNRILHVVREFCRDRQLSFYSTKTHTGYLRNLVIRQSESTNDVMVNLVTTDDKPDVLSAFSSALLGRVPSITTIVNNITQRKNLVAVGDYEKVYHGPGFITEKIGKRTYRISANSFFQTNTKQAERLYDVAKQMARLRPTDVVFDLYSGTGTIALHIADEVQQVVGVENVAAAVEDARRNAAANGVTNCTFVLGDLKDRLTKDTEWLQKCPRPTVVMIDPPRAGMHEKVVKEVLHLQPERIVYISCNPATQARDLKLMAGAYRIAEVQPVDMFPHTYHIENVVGMIRK